MDNQGIRNFVGKDVLISLAEDYAGDFANYGKTFRLHSVDDYGLILGIVGTGGNASTTTNVGNLFVPWNALGYITLAAVTAGMSKVA